ERPRQRAKQPPRVISDPDCSKLIACTAEAHQPLMALLCFTGLRISEALGLLWENVDLTAGVLHVEAQLARKKRGQPVKRVPLKGARRGGSGERRDVDQVPVLTKLLKRHKADQFAEGFAGAGDYVHTTGIGTPLTYKNFLDRIFTPAADKAGL